MMVTKEQSRGLIRKDGKYLILRKKSDSPEKNGKWELPGGKIESGETPEKALRREIIEETNLSCKIIKKMDSITVEDHTAHIFLCEPFNDEVKLSDEHNYYLWASVKEIEKLPLVLFADLLIKYLYEAEEVKNN